MRKILAALCITLALGISPAFAALPTTITYQGYLTNNTGAALTGAVSMVVSLYAAQTGGSALWMEPHTAVPVTNGIYTVQLGSVDTTLVNKSFDADYWLGVAVNGEAEMTPRLQLASVPTAFRAMSADKLNQACNDGQMLTYTAASSSWSCTTALSIAQGGTGTSTAPTPGGVIYAGSGAALASTAAGTAGQVLTSNGGSAPTWATASGGWTTTGNDINNSNSGSVLIAKNLVLPKQVDATAAVQVLDAGGVAQNFLHAYGASGVASNNLFAGLTAGNTTMTGNSNTGLGGNALKANTSGVYNVAVGYSALGANTSGATNVAIGYKALWDHASGNQNVAIGTYAGWGTNTGQDNTLIGYGAGMYLSGTANSNTFLGNYAGAGYATAPAVTNGVSGQENVAVGLGAGRHLTTGVANIALGVTAGDLITTGNSNIHIGNSGVAADTNTLRLGTVYNGSASPATGQNAAYIAGIYGVTPVLASPQTVVIDSNGQLGSVAASSGGSGTVTSIATSGPLTGGTITTTGTIGIDKATGSVDGYLAATDFAIFDGKQAALTSGTNLKTVGGNSLLGSGDAGAIGIGYGGTGLTTIGTTGKVLTSNGSAASWELTNVGAGYGNTLAGSGALGAYSSGTGNTAIGLNALGASVSAASNTAVGMVALTNATAGPNTAIGASAGQNVTTGMYNSFVGASAGVQTNSGSSNLGLGDNALYTNTTGSNNVALGRWADVSDATASNRIAIGYGATATADNQLVFGSDGTLNATSTLTPPALTQVVPGKDNSASLGSASKRWTGLYLSTPLAVDQGGTGLGTVGTDGQVLTASGGALTWGTPSSGGVTSVSFGTTGLTPATDTTGAVTVAGTLAVANGGTGLTSAGSNGQVLTIVSGAPAWAAAGGGGIISDVNGNTGVGASALQGVNTASNNTAVGKNALSNTMTSASGNTAIGVQALAGVTSGTSNTAVGSSAGSNVGTASYNTFMGYKAGSTAAGGNNVAVGGQALQSATSGTYNVVVGMNAGAAFTTGSYNVAIGDQAGSGIAAGTYNVYLGSNAQSYTEGSTNRIAIGKDAEATADNTAVIGGPELTTVVLGSNASPGNQNSALTSVIPAKTNVASLGSASKLWTDVYIAGKYYGDGSQLTGVVKPTVPSSAGDSCTAGTVVGDDTYIYICVSSGAWIRAAHTAAIWP
jgi:hypothetical protein